MLSIHASAFDFVEFVSAIHTLSKLNSVLAYTQISLNHNVNCVQVAGVQLFVGTQRAASESAVKVLLADAARSVPTVFT
jgi:hypothetical protein